MFSDSFWRLLLTAGYQVVHAVYRKYEVDPAFIVSTTALLLVPPSIVTYLLSAGNSSLIKALSTAFSVFFAVLIGSIIWYRISPFHPLSKYPGPFIARVSKFHALKIMVTGKNHLYHKGLHEKYGPYVRVGEKTPIIRDSLC